MHVSYHVPVSVNVKALLQIRSLTGCYLVPCIY